MKANTFKAILVKTGFVASILLLTSGVSFAQSVVNLSAAPTQAALPDGQMVPMWGYTCTGTPTSATCAAANPNAGTNWSPVVITVPYNPSGTSLTINLTNSLSFTAGLGTNSVPTSLVIVGQLGGGLGDVTQRTTTLSPQHGPQGPTWPASGGPDPSITDCSAPGAAAAAAAVGTNCPPPQPPRVQSFATEVATGATTALTWSNLRPGTYLIHSGTHPSIQSPMGLYGVLVVTTAPVTGTTPARGIAYSTPLVNYDAEVPLLLSEIDPVQNKAVATAVATTGFNETKVWSGQPGMCGDLSATATAEANTCYPPAVNYSPRYYLVNGVSFDRTGINATSNTSPSLFPTSPATTTGTVLVRFVNAGLRMHVPSIVRAQTTDSSSGTATTVSGFSLIAEDGNVLPGNPKVQNQVFLAAGKTYDVLMNAPASGAPALPVYDRQLSLSTNNQRDGGMQAYIGVNAATLASSASLTAQANPDSYFLISGNTLVVDNPAKGVIANDVGVSGVAVATGPAGLGSTLSLNPNGTFSYVPGAGVTSDSFTYCGNGDTSGSPPLCTTVTLAACASGCLGGAPVANADGYTSTIASRLHISPPGVLANDTDPSGLPLKAATLSNVTGGTVTLNPDGSFVAAPATPPTGAGSATVSFQYTAVNSQNTSSAPAMATVTFTGGNGFAIAVKDAKNGLAINDYRWIIEEDRTFYVDPKCQINSTVRPAGCAPLPVESLGYSFHTANMPVVATGCIGAISCESGQTLLGTPAACDVGNGVCRTDAGQKVAVTPDQVALDPTKRYYLSILPGDGINTTLGGGGAPVADPSVPGGTRQFNIAKDCGPFDPSVGTVWEAGGANALCGHAMGGAPISGAQVAAGSATSINVSLQQTPLPTAKLAVFVYEDDNPLNGENDAGGGVDVIAPNEPGLGGFELKLFDQAGGLGDNTGQLTYDMFNMPVSNALAGTIDPVTGLDACPISKNPDGLVGMIPTCPKFESDGTTLSPLAGQAIIANMYPGLYEVVATPAADRIARGEEWLQTNTLDGGKAHEAFLKPNEPGYFQEFGPGGFHVSIGFANPKIINARRTNATGTGICDPKPNGGGLTCTATLNGRVTSARMSRTPDQRIYNSGSYDAYSFTQCYVGLGLADSPDFAFAKCNPDGTFTLSGLPTGDFKITVFDQWNDLIVDGLVSPVRVDGSTTSIDFPVVQWRTNIYTRTFIDTNGDGVSQESEPGLALVSTNIRYRDGSFGFFNNTDLNGYAGFNEVFPFLNWLVVETADTRYKPTGSHVVYDAGGLADGTAGGGTSTIAAGLANTIETVPLPAPLRVPGARYCASADCPAGDTAGGSTGRVDPPWVTTQGWQGLLGQNSFIEFGMKPFAAGENGGIKGHVIYASTRPFDDPSLSLQLSWEPGVPRVKINLYQEGTAADGTKSLKLVDTTTTTSWDDWAQGFRSDGMPNMNCPGQSSTSPFFATLQDSKQYLDPANPKTALPNHSQFKCYDGWSMLNQVQPAPYDGMYKFPSVTNRSPTTGLPTATNCSPSICVDNPTGDGTKMLPAGKYVVEVIVPPGFELVKEEDKNILLGDSYIAPITQQFAGLGNIFIMPDQAAMNAYYNKNNTLNMTTNLGATPHHEGDTGSIESFWPCVGAMRIVPDFNSLFPTSGQNSPFAGASRPLCDRKEVTLEDQASVLAKFYVFTPTHIAGHFTGSITNDFASEFDPFSPQFGEKFAPPNLPVGLRDFSGNEVSRVYADQWGMYNGLYFSSYGVNPPNPTGYVPQMAIFCMNDPGPIPDPSGAIDPITGKVRLITDPAYSPAYSNFCYETPFMPGSTAYLDTPVIPTMAFADGYNLPDCEYPDTTPAISKVVSSNAPGPWVSASGAGHSLTITSLGDKVVLNPAYSGPTAINAPFNQKEITRHYGFGATAGTVALVGSDGVSRPLTSVSWSDTTISGTVPANVPLCALQQRGTGNGGARCAELVITAANGKKSIDAVTVTIGGKAPTLLASGQTIQSAIDAATSGDLIIIPPGTYKENLLMWKPVRLQGIGAASVTINADAHPAEKMDVWRRQVVCLFGLALNGQPISASNPYDPSGLYTCSDSMRQQSDRIPFEGIIGWDVSVSGNLAEMLQEPTLMGAYEGAGITVLGKGVWIPVGSEQFGVGNAGGFPAGYRYLTNSNADCTPSTTIGRDYATANFLCNPSRIDGISVINSSQGGGAIFLHAWNHNMEVANNRISANHGTLTGGITVGNGEFPDPFIVGGDVALPFSTSGLIDGQQAGYGFNRHVNVHHNSVTANASIGDALYSGTPSGAGGVTFCVGADNYQFNYNWVCGNLSTGDGAGVVHSGFTNDGTISHNSILFNQSTNPTIPTSGGGLAVLGASPDRTITLPDGTTTECGATSDLDCPPGLSEGTGRNLLIDANLIIGNSAESGSGGGLRLQAVNGLDVPAFPLLPMFWHQVTVTNNIIANNVAGWDGGGVSMQDALKVDFINNTVAANDTTGSAGVLFKTIGSAFASSPPPGCDPGSDPTATCYSPDAPSVNQPAGLVTMKNSPNLIAALPPAVQGGLLGLLQGVNCPPQYYGLSQVDDGICRTFSLPLMKNNMFWQNRAFHIVVGGFGPGLQSQQHLVTLVPALNQASTGACASGAAYWDIGVRGDSSATSAIISPAVGGNGVATNPTLGLSNSILTSFSGRYSGNGNLAPGTSPVIAQYCNGSRVPPENGGHGYNAPPGRSETVGLSDVFTLNNIMPAATVDEGQNWINLSYGPLSLYSNAGQVMVADAAFGEAFGAYSIRGTSAAVNAGSNSGAPARDFFGNTRPNGANVDIGAVEFVPTVIPIPVVTPASLAFGNVLVGATSASQSLTLSNNGGATFTISSIAVSAPFSRVAGGCGASLAAGANCTITVTFSPTVLGLANGTVTISGNVTVTNSPVALSGTGVAATHTASVSPSPLAFGNWAIGTTSPTQNLTVTNTGNSNLTGLSFTLGGGLPFSRVTTGTFPAGAPNCGSALLVGAACTVKLQFAPTTVAAFSRTFTVAGTGVTVTPTPATLTGSGVASRATVSITPNPDTITLASGVLSGTDTVTLTNTAPVGTGANMTVSGVGVSGGNIFTFFFNVEAGQDNCTGASLAPGASCTVGVRFTNVLSPRGANRSGTITFTDIAQPTPSQSGALVGFATP
jgi:hypothetical protein